MKKLILALFLTICAHVLQAQYLHYWDDSRPRRRAQPAQKQNPPAEKNLEPVKVIEKKPEPPVITSPLRLKAATLITAVTLPVNKVALLPEIIREPVIFHDWPDQCPGLTGAVPVLINYVPAEIVLIVTEKFKGHLYSICTNKGPDDMPEYKLKVCEDGMIKYEYADYKGNIISKE
jgi:hypothetical protein